MGFEPMHVSIADLKPAALTTRPKVQWATHLAAHCTNIVCFLKMHPMGFEPMRVSTTELESVALDHSAKGAIGDHPSHLLYSVDWSLGLGS